MTPNLQRQHSCGLGLCADPVADSGREAPTARGLKWIRNPDKVL